MACSLVGLSFGDTSVGYKSLQFDGYRFNDFNNACLANQMCNTFAIIQDSIGSRQYSLTQLNTNIQKYTDQCIIYYYYSVDDHSPDVLLRIRNIENVNPEPFHLIFNTSDLYKLVQEKKIRLLINESLIKPSLYERIRKRIRNKPSPVPAHSHQTRTVKRNTSNQKISIMQKLRNFMKINRNK